MATNALSSCSFFDCLIPCLITFVVTLVILAIIHIIIYFQLVKLAKQRYGIEGFLHYSPHNKYKTSKYSSYNQLHSYSY